MLVGLYAILSFAASLNGLYFLAFSILDLSKFHVDAQLQQTALSLLYRNAKTNDSGLFPFIHFLWQQKESLSLQKH